MESYIEISGKHYPLRMTMGALLDFQRSGAVEPKADGAVSIEQLLQLMFCCVRSASRADGIEFSYTFEEFCDHVTPADVEKWNALQAEGNKKKGSPVKV